MNRWIIATMIVGLLVFAGIVVVNAISNDDVSITTTKTCTGCQKSCTGENNCGLSQCGSVSGGSCSCGK
jgi:hypothetical protein